MNAMIESPSNPRIKELVKLRESSRRRKERGVFFVEGGDDLIALARAGRTVQEVYSCPVLPTRPGAEDQLEELSAMGIPVTETSSSAHAKASYRAGGHEMIGVVQSWNLEITDDLFEKNRPLVVLDEVEKPGNLGAILRSVEAFGGAGVLLSDPALDYFNPNVVRSSRGLMGHVPLAAGSKAEVLGWLKKSGRKIFATSARAKGTLGHEKLPVGATFIFGSEKLGLGEFWKIEEMDWLCIPMMGTASSLNLNVSVGCLLYEYSRQ
jgi:TrmH family RNA methyltransferase